MDKVMSTLFVTIVLENERGDGMPKRDARTPEEVVSDQSRRHQGDWLTYDAAASYRKKAEALGYGNSELTGERFSLYKELQEKYGVTQLEAINILNGRCISDYVEKYQRIKNLIPLKVDKKTKVKNMEKEE